MSVGLRWNAERSLRWRRDFILCESQAVLGLSPGCSVETESTVASGKVLYRQITGYVTCDLRKLGLSQKILLIITIIN